MNLQTKERLAQAISQPGFEDWRSAVDVPQLDRPLKRPEGLAGKGRVAAVLILLYPNQQPGSGSDSEIAAMSPANQRHDDWELDLVLTKRNARLSNHAGQISFPGGRKEEGESLWQAACRETFEEIGIGEIEFLGQLNSVYIPPSDFTVSPFVGWLDSRPKFNCAFEEVEAIVESSVAHLLDPATLKHGEVSSADRERLEVPFYAVGEHRVWGATAIMLSELLERIRRSTQNTAGTFQP